MKINLKKGKLKNLLGNQDETRIKTSYLSFFRKVLKNIV